MSSKDDSRPLSSFPFSLSQRRCLERARFITVADVLELKLSKFATELKITQSEALDIRRVIRTPSSAEITEGETDERVPHGESGLDRLKRDASRPPILTFCADMDDVLGGGVQIGQITEFCGWPGIGKTQLCKQLAVDVQLPSALAGAEGAAIYIDTEGSFMVERVVQMCEEFINHLKYMVSREETFSKQQREAVSSITLESLLSNIHYYRVTDYVEQVALIHALPKILKNHQNVRVILLDSVAFHFRHNFTDMGLRTRLLSQMAQQLQAIADKHDIAVVVTNQVTTRVVDDKSSFLAPALGDTWSHAVTNRVLLFWQDGQRYAHLLKSPAFPNATAPYLVSSLGIRGMAKRKKRVREPDVPIVESEGPVKEAVVSVPPL